MKNKKIFASLITSVLALTLCVAVTETVKNSNSVESYAAETDHKVRVWAVLEGDWDNGSAMHIHYWGGSNQGSTWGQMPYMTQVIDNYYTGLWYYDLPHSDYTHCLFICSQWDSWGKNSNQSVDVDLSKLNTKAAFVGSWKNDNSKRTVRFDSVGTSAADMAQVLDYNHYKPCDPSYASGYNAYPQFKSIFLDVFGSDQDLNTKVNCSATATTTIGNTINQMRAQYNKYNDPDLANIIAKSTANNNILFVAIFASLTSVVAATLIIKNKKKHN